MSHPHHILLPRTNVPILGTAVAPHCLLQNLQSPPGRAGVARDHTLPKGCCRAGTCVRVLQSHHSGTAAAAGEVCEQLTGDRITLFFILIF